MKQKVRRGVEPPEVRRFLRQELLTKVGHSWWNRPRVYRYDRDEEREPMQSLRSVVVVPQGQEQQELSPAVPGGRTTLLGPVASPVASLPHTPGRDIVVIGSSEESPRTREGRLAAATLEQAMGRRSVAGSHTTHPGASSRLVVVSRENHHAGNGGRGLRHPRPGKAPRLPTRVARERQEPYRGPAGGREGRGWSPGRTSYPAAEVGIDARTAGGRIPGGKERKPESALFSPSPSSGRSRHHPCAAACPRPRHQRVMRTTSQAGRKIRRAVGRDLQGRWRTIRKRRGPIRRKRQGRSHRQHNWSWPSLMDWTFRPSRRSVICLRGPGPRFTSRGRRSGWSGPPRSGDEGRPRPWHSSWVDEGVNITRAGTAPCDNDQSAASMPLTSTTDGGMWTARMHNSTVGRVLDGLVSARATGNREPEGMNEILRNIPPRRAVLPVPEPTRASPRADGTFPETGD